MAVTRPTAFLLLALSLSSSSVTSHSRENFNVSQLSYNYTHRQLPCHTTLATKEECVAENEETEVLQSLRALLATVVKEELSHCILVIAADQGFQDSVILTDLLRLPNLRQVVEVVTAEDFYGLLWKASQCLGFVFLLQDPTPFLEFVNIDEDPWAFSGKHVIVGATKSQLQMIAHSKKGMKTEHIIGLVQINRNGDWNIYMNQLFWGPGVVVGNRWHQGAFTSASDLFPDKVSDLRGATIKVISFEYAPHVFYVKNSTQMYGRDVEVIRAVAKVLNFTAVFEEPPLGQMWGKRLPNGTWDGLVGLLGRNEAHIGVANSFISDNNGRLRVLEYSQPYDVDESCFLIRSAAELPRWQSLALPFTPYVWLGVVVAFVCTSPFLFWLAKGGEARGESFRSLADAYLCAWGIQLREPHTFYPVCTSTRIFVASLWFSSVILTMAYSSHLTAFLTIRTRPDVLKTFKELYEANIDVSSIGEFFNISMAATGNYHLQSLTKRYFISKNVDEALVQVKLGRTAMIAGRKSLEYLISTQFSSSGEPTMRVMKECFAPYSVGVTLQRHTPLKRNINLALERMVESGLVTRWFSEALSRHRRSTEVDTDQTDADERNHVTPLNIHHMQGVFLILIFGYVASTVVFVIEVLRDKNAP